MQYGYDENDNNNMNDETKCETNYSINNKWNNTRNKHLSWKACVIPPTRGVGTPTTSPPPSQVLVTLLFSRFAAHGDPFGPILFALAVHPAIAEARAATEISHPGGIDICSFFLDDGFCAGSAPAVRYFLSALTKGFRCIGLTVNLDKMEAIPTCSLAQSFCSWNGTSNSWVLLLCLMRGARSFLVTAPARLEPSSQPLVSAY